MEYDHKSDLIILFGGETDGNERLSDTWVYDYHETSWKRLSVGHTPDSFGYYSWNIGIASGFDEEKDLTIFTKSFVIWTLDVQNEEWIEIDNYGRGDYVDIQIGNQLTYISGEDKFIQFGGVSSNLDIEDGQVELHLSMLNTTDRVTTSDTIIETSSDQMSWNFAVFFTGLIVGSRYFNSTRKIRKMNIKSMRNLQ
jgi:hypothetical protein